MAVAKDIRKQTGHFHFDWPLIGKLRTDVDPSLIGESNFRELVNFRYSPDGIKGIQGMTPINATPLTYTTTVNGFYYRKDNTSEYHTFVQGTSGSNSVLYLSDNTTNIPNQDTFSSFQILENENTVFFSEAPNNGVCVCNGVINRIWEGYETNCGQFIVFDPAGSFWYDYTDQVNYSLPNISSSTIIPLDNFEYGTDALAQAAYVTSSVLGWDILDEECTDISSWTNNDVGNGVSSVSPAGQFSFAANAHKTPNYAARFQYISSPPNEFTLEIKTYFDSLANGFNEAVLWYQSNTWALNLYWSSFQGLVIKKTGGADVVVTTDVPHDANARWQTWRFQVNKTVESSATAEIFLDDVSLGTFDCNYTASFGDDGRIQYVQYGQTTSGMLSHLDFIKIATGLGEPTLYYLQDYSEATIKTQGYYSLKAIALAGVAGAYLEKTFSPIDLTGVNTLLLDTESTLTGSNYSIGIYNSNTAVWTTTTPNIIVANDFQNISWDISGVVDANKNSITKIRITAITDGWTAYFDNFFANKSGASLYTNAATMWTVGGVCSVYIASQRPIQGATFYIGTANTSAATATGFQWNGSAWAGLTISDGTSVGGKTLAKSGEISFASTVGTSVPKAINTSVAYYYKFVFTGIDSGVTVIHCTIDAPMQPTTDLWDGVNRSVMQCLWHDDSSSKNYTDYTTNVAASTSSNPKVYYKSNPWTFMPFYSDNSSFSLYLAFAEPQMGIFFHLADGKDVNTNASNMTVNYCNGIEFTPVTDLQDGTSDSGVTLSHSGIVTWSPPIQNTEFKTNVYNQNQWYYYQITFDHKIANVPIIVEGVPSHTTVNIDTIGGITSPKTISPYRFSALWQNRLWLFNDQAYKKNYGICSNYGTNSVFNGDDTVEFEFGTKELMCAESMYSRYGSNLYDNLIVCGRDSTYLIDGTSPSNWILYTVSDKKGCIAPLTFKKCDMGFEVAEGITKHVLIWRASGSIEFFDGNTIATISDDIENFFDPSKTEYIDPMIYDVSQESAGYDENNGEYHWIFTNIDGKQEWIYNLADKKWSRFYRGTGKSLNCFFPVQDNQGTGYLYGGTTDGFVERLENGTTFDGNPIWYRFFLGDILLAKTAMYVTKLRHIKLTAKSKNVSAATITATYYPDAAITGTTLLPIQTQKDLTHRLYQAKWSIDQNAVFHGLCFDMTTTNEVIGMEPLLVSGLYEILREDLL